MKVTITNNESAAGIRVIVNGDVENETVLSTGTSLAVEAGSIVVLRELGVPSLVDTDPSRLIGD